MQRKMISLLGAAGLMAMTTAAAVSQGNGPRNGMRPCPPRVGHGRGVGGQVSAVDAKAGTVTVASRWNETRTIHVGAGAKIFARKDTTVGGLKVGDTVQVSGVFSQLTALSIQDGDPPAAPSPSGGRRGRGAQGGRRSPGGPSRGDERDFGGPRFEGGGQGGRPGPGGPDFNGAADDMGGPGAPLDDLGGPGGLGDMDGPDGPGGPNDMGAPGGPVGPPNDAPPSDNGPRADARDQDGLSPDGGAQGIAQASSGRPHVRHRHALATTRTVAEDDPAGPGRPMDDRNQDGRPAPPDDFGGPGAPPPPMDGGEPMDGPRGGGDRMGGGPRGGGHMDGGPRGGRPLDDGPQGDRSMGREPRGGVMQNDGPGDGMPLDGGAPGGVHISGKITSLSPLTITVGGSLSLVIKTDSKTRVTKIVREALAEIQKGDRIFAAGSMTNGALTAKSIAVNLQP